MKREKFIKQLDRIMAVERNKTTDITVTEINSSLFNIMLNFNKGFEYTCKDKLIKMLEEILEQFEKYHTLVWYDTISEYFDYNYRTIAYFASVEVAIQNLLLWEYEESDLYLEVLENLEDIDILSSDYPEKEIFFVKCGTQTLLVSTSDILDIDIIDTVSKESAKKMLDFLKD